uniref:Pyruvate phosphate dikinase AMP/ATP-binding domain-containing protein n=1 Tax=Timema poppense TaxID=170557 RepID=A0A7R9DT53_TIMPO|nr:unnamed protein product [Timema poppensis]
MGVVVQQMVSAHSAGVLFTRHPVTGDPRHILITANYGLGESVVSALVEPDTILLNRGTENKITIKEIVCGKKAHKITMTASKFSFFGPYIPCALQASRSLSIPRVTDQLPVTSLGTALAAGISNSSLRRTIARKNERGRGGIVSHITVTKVLWSLCFDQTQLESVPR